MITYRQAIEIIEENAGLLKPSTERTGLVESCNRVLAEDIYSDSDLPAFDNSAMDGYAVVFTPERRMWNVAGEIAAGKYHEQLIDDATAVRIMTGAKIPPGTDTIIPIEDVIESDSGIILREDVRIFEGQHIRSKGAYLKQGEVAIHAGTLLHPQNIGLAASCGKTELLVYRPLKAAICATGDELVDITEIPTDDKIRASNLYALEALFQRMNLQTNNFGIIPDDVSLMQKCFSDLLKSDTDIIVSTGGVSMGKYDFVKGILSNLGVSILFDKVNIRPGKPLVFGTYHHGERVKFVFGLPGNPVSSLVTATVFIRHLINSIYGISIRNSFSAILENDIRKDDSKRHFLRARLRFDHDACRSRVTVFESQSSGNLTTHSEANCLVVFKEEYSHVRKGEMVECILI